MRAFKLATSFLAVFAITELRSETMAFSARSDKYSRCVFSIWDFDAVLDLFPRPADGTFPPLHQTIDFLKPLGHRQGLKQVLFLLDLDPEECPRPDRPDAQARTLSVTADSGFLSGNVFLDLWNTARTLGDGFSATPELWFHHPGLFLPVRYSAVAFKEAIVFKIIR